MQHAPAPVYLTQDSSKGVTAENIEMPEIRRYRIILPHPFTAFCRSFKLLLEEAPDASESFHQTVSLIIPVYLPGKKNKVIAYAINNQ